MRILVSVKQLGKRRDTVAPVAFELGARPETVGELIAETVRVCVREYNERQESGDILRSLTAGEIDDQAQGGKIGFGVNYGGKAQDEGAALANAQQAFSDGLFRIFLNDEELTTWEEKIALAEDDRLVFIRLTMLAGRMW